MFRLLVVAAILMIFTSHGAAAQDGKMILGKWYTADRESIVEISYIGKDQGFSGTVVWVNESVGKKKAAKILGRCIFSGLTYSVAENKYTGSIYVPQLDAVKDCEITVDGMQASVRVHVGFFTKTSEWERCKQE